MTVWRALILFCLVVAGAGCGSKPTLVGKWKGNLAIQSFFVEMELEFRPDGNLAFTQTANGQGSTQKGPYTAAEKSFTFTPTSVDSPNLSKEQADKLSAQLAATKKPITFSVEWKDADNITVTQQGAPPPLDVPIELKRVHER